MIAAAMSRRLKFEAEMRKTVVCGVSVLDTERSSSRHGSTIGGNPDWEPRKCHEALTKNSLAWAYREAIWRTNGLGMGLEAYARLRRGYTANQALNINGERTIWHGRNARRTRDSAAGRSNALCHGAGDRRISQERIWIRTRLDRDGYARVWAAHRAIADRRIAGGWGKRGICRSNHHPGRSVPGERKC